MFEGPQKEEVPQLEGATIRGSATITGITVHVTTVISVGLEKERVLLSIRLHVFKTSALSTDLQRGLPDTRTFCTKK